MMINGIEIKAYNHGDDGLTIIINTAKKDMDGIDGLINQYTDRSYRLICFAVPNWNDDLSPWFSPRVFKGGSDCGGKANDYFHKMITIIDTLVQNDHSPMIIAGYSLAGLFALYSAYQCDRFSGVVSASGSLWFPNWRDYVIDHRISPQVSHVYLSLGDKESKTKHKIFQTTEPISRWLDQYYRDQGIDSYFELNIGNHFQDNEYRLAKGIVWMLERMTNA